MTLGCCGDNTSERPICAGVVAVLATPVAAWWLVGDQSFNGHRRRDELDYMFRAPQISGWITTVAGIVALVVWAALRAWWIVTHPNAPAMGSA